MKQKQDLAGSGVAGSETTTVLDNILLTLCFVLMFLAMTVTTGQMSMVMVGLALVLTITYVLVVDKRSLATLKQSISIPVVGFLGFAVMNGLAALYSPFGLYSVAELNKFLASFAVAALLLFCIQKRHVNGVIWGLTSISAVIGAIGLDAAFHGPIFDIFARLMHVVGVDYSYMNEPANYRLTGIYNDANVTASIMALGCLLALYLMVKEDKLWKRFAAAVLLGVSAMSMFMSVSRGAMLCFALALLVWLVAAGKGQRIRLFLVIIISAGITVAFAALSMEYFGIESLVPDLFALLCGPVIFLLDWLVGVRLGRVLERNLKLALGVAAVLTVGCVVFGAVAVNTSEPYMLQKDQTMIRSIKLAPGEYSVSGDWDGAPKLTVYANSQQDILMQRHQDIYNGPLAGAVFTIPEDTVAIQVYVHAPEADTELREIAFSDGTKLHLGYPLLPDFIYQRLQDGLLHGHNFSQRIQYARDAVKLMVQSPLLGHGLGSTEGLYTSVQPYFYQSRYAHNHILQVLCDMGLVGGAFFLTMLFGVAWLLLRRLWAERDMLAAVLLACWVMINAHSLMEINFSIRGYQCFVFPLLLLACVCYASPLKKKLLKGMGIAVGGGIWLYMLVFGGLMEKHNMVQRQARDFATSDAHEFMKRMEGFIRGDVFDHEQLQLSYVANAVVINDPAYTQKLADYINELRTSGTYTACSGLAKHVFLPMGNFEELFICSREAIVQEASNKDAWNLQFNFYRTEVLQYVSEDNYEQFISGVLGTKAYLETYSTGRWEEIQLSEENSAFLELVQSLYDQKTSPKEGMIQLMIQLQNSQSDKP